MSDSRKIDRETSRLEFFLCGSGVFAIVALMVLVARSVPGFYAQQLENAVPIVAVAPAPTASPAPAPTTNQVAAAETSSGTEAPEESAPGLPDGMDPRDAELWSLAGDPSVIKIGRESYDVFCYACHFGPTDGQGSPSNVFDDTWYHGGEPTEIDKSIRVGIMEKGMPGWNGMIPDDEIDAITAYLLSYQNPPLAANESISR